MEDDPEDAEIFRRHAEKSLRYNIEIKHVISGKETIKQLSRKKYDIVFFDLRLGGAETGLDILKSIKSLKPEIPAIALTGTGNEKIAVNIMKNGALDYLLKDNFNTDIVDRTIGYALEHYGHITKQKKLQEQLIQSEKMAAIGKLTAGTAHEINNPLTGIIGFSQLLKEESGLNKKQKEEMEMIYSQALRIKQIVSNLISFARKEKSEKKPVSINDLLNETLEKKSNELKNAGIKIVKEFIPQLPLVEANNGEIQQVFFNIITNAQQAMSSKVDNKKGNLTIKTYTKGDMVITEFIDNGQGIAKENLNKIFEPFFTTREVGKGTGLGLSVTYGIIKEHQGDISVESEIGKGTKFIIELPIMFDGKR